MLIAQITDLHIGLPDSEVVRQCATPQCLEAAVKHINRLDPRPDLVLATGDLCDTGAAEEYRRLAALLAPLEFPLYLIPGNHDDRDNLRAAFTDHAYLHEDKNFLHYAVDDYPLRLLGLDTLDPGEMGGDMCAKRCAWLDETLSSAPETPTLIFMHHPPFKTGLAHMDGMGLANADKFAAVVARHHQIAGILSGHQHRPVTTSFHGTTAQVAPGIAHQVELSLGEGRHLSIVMEPPACMLHLWNPGQALVSHTSYIGDYRQIS